ncbi:MAG TPA: GAF domain-containing protein, partial [Anaerolineales bacterium]|nr:GAF domain-containing protein [Anaerolineales bacterium]
VKKKQVSVNKEAKRKSAPPATKSTSDQVDIKRQLKVQKALYKIADAASASRDIQSFYKKLHRIVDGLIYAKSFYVLIYDEVQDTVGFEDGYFIDAFGDPTPPPGPLSQYEKTPSAMVLKSSQTMHLPRAKMDKLTQDGILNPTGSKSVDWVGVPLRDKKKAFGALIIQSYEEGIIYSEDAVRLLEFVAQHISTSITRARAIKETRQRNAELAIINSVQEGLASRLDIQDIYTLVGNKIREIFKADTAYIISYNHKKKLVYSHYYMDKGKPIPPMELPFGQGLYTRVIKSGKPLLFGTEQESIKAGATSITSPGHEKELNESTLVVPLLRGKEVTGVLSVQSYEQNAYDENDVRLLTTLANSMSVALQNAQSFKAEQERVAELAIINAVQGALAAELDIYGIYEAVGEKLREIFKVQTITIYSFDLKEKTAILEYGYEKGQKYASVALPSNSLYDHIVDLDSTFVMNDSFPEFAKQFKDYKVPRGEMPRSMVVVPVLKSKDGNRKVLVSIQDVDGVKTFSDSDVRLLETLASAMNVALQNAQSFKAEQERVAELQIINSIQQGLAAELDFQSIVDLVGDKLREVFNTPDLAITWHDEKVNLTHYLYIYEHGIRQTHPPKSPKPGGIFDKLKKTSKPVVLNSVAEGLKFSSSKPYKNISGEDIKSSATVPIISSDRVIGAINTENLERENAYGESELRLLTTIAASLGTALESARLFDETQRLFKAEQE